jgi:hypothetical protein
METGSTPQTPSLEQQTDEQRQAYILSARRRIRQGVFLALVTLLTIFSLCVAWFLNNARVSANAMQLQNGASGSFELATAGTSGGRFEALLGKLFPGTASAESWASGELQGTRTSSEANAITWQMSDASNLSNLSAGSGLEPGMRGYLTFYVIPSQSGALHLQCSLTELLYEIDADGNPVELADSDEKAKTLAALMNKHLLFFLLEPVSAADIDNTGNVGTPEAAGETADESGEAEGQGSESEEATGTPAYTATWIQDGTFTLELADVEAGEPQEVTLYWVWPYLFGQLLIENSEKLLGQPALLDSAKIANASELYDALRSDILGTAATDDDAPSATDTGTDTDSAPDADPNTGEDAGTGSAGSVAFLPGYFYAEDGAFSLVLSETADSNGGQAASPETILNSIAQGDTSALASSEYASMNEAYNDADQYIGLNLSYLAVRLTATTN